MRLLKDNSLKMKPRVVLLASVYWICDKCKTTSVIDSICAGCGAIMDMNYDESYRGGVYDREEGGEVPSFIEEGEEVGGVED